MATVLTKDVNVCICTHRVWIVHYCHVIKHCAHFNAMIPTFWAAKRLFDKS